MEFLKEHKNSITFVVVVALAFAAYVIFFRGGGDENLSVSEAEGGMVGGVEQELLATLLELRSVELDGSIFSDPAFRSLRDFNQPLEPQPVGRNNPFAPFE